MLRGRISAAQLAELAGQEITRDWRLSPADLPRLAQLLPENGSETACKLHAQVRVADGDEGIAVVHIAVEGSWTLICQRCLDAIDCQVAVESALSLVASDSEAERLADPFDCVVVSADGVELIGVVEDEVLASLPMSPTHAVEEDCGRQPIERSVAPGDAKIHRPFAGLAELMSDDTADPSR